jgi:hypothetical protein
VFTDSIVSNIDGVYTTFKVRDTARLDAFIGYNALDQQVKIIISW